MRTKIRLLSLLLCSALLFSLCSPTAFAEAQTIQDSGQITVNAGSLCEHHIEHTSDCGYTEGEPETPCIHEHVEDCYTEVTECVHMHTADCYPEETESSVSGNNATPSNAEEREPEKCDHVCNVESGCITKELNCQHEHDGECGYVPATEETPCGYVCEICNAEGDGETATLSNTEEAVTVESIQGMIDDLPNADEITENNAEEVKEQLEAIDEAKAQLSDEEIDVLDFARYIEAAAALEQLLYGAATPSNAVMPLTDYNGPAIMNGTDNISGYDKVNKKYDYIYYGEWESSPIKWRVLDNQTNTQGTGLFLLSDVLLGTGKQGDVPFNELQNESNVWQNSNAQKWCEDFYTNNFSSTEQSAVLETTKSDDKYELLNMVFAASDDILNRDRVFFLSAAEASNGNYGFAEQKARIAKYGNEDCGWWLRSPSIYAQDCRPDSVGMIHKWGDLLYSLYNVPYAARPAFNLNRNSVLFTSAAEGGKDDTTDADLTTIGTGTGEWKLTLKDNNRNGFTASTSSDTTKEEGYSGWTVAVSYSGAQTGDNEYVSAVIADDRGTILCYGRIAQNSASGTASVTIPTNLQPGSYTLKVFSEQYNGDKKTDYASAFANIPLTVTDATAPTLTGGTATRDSEANATVKFTSDEAGSYYYAVVNNGDSAPTIDTTGAGFSCDTTEQTIFLDNLTGADAKDIYIVVKDPAGNVSSPALKMTIPTYVAPSYGISATPSTLNFGSKTEGYTTAPTEQTVTIENTGNQTITLNQPMATDFTISSLSATELAAGGTATLTVQPKTGLAVGSHNDTLSISGSDGVNASVSLSFAVTEKAHVHEYSADWVHTETSHWRECSCGAKTDEAAHVYDGGQDTTCNTCDYVRGVAPATYILTVELNGGSGSTVGGKYAEGAVISIDAGSRSNYRFNGWTTSNGGSFANASSASTIFTMPAANTTITASWEQESTLPTEYIVTVQTNGNGTASASPTSATEGEKITLTAKANSGYHFKEWQVVSGNAIISGNSFTMPAGNVTVKAIFEKDRVPSGEGGSSILTTYYSLTFESNGGSKIEKVTEKSGNTVDLSGYLPTREGYDFNGWYSDKGLTRKITEIELNSNKTVYAAKNKP